MALIDYKIVDHKRNGRDVTLRLRLYRGALTFPSIFNVDTKKEETSLVEVYQRIALVLERVYNFTVPDGITRQELIVKLRAYLNKKILELATQAGHIVIIQQQNVSDLDPLVTENI